MSNNQESIYLNYYPLWDFLFKQIQYQAILLEKEMRHSIIYEFENKLTDIFL